MQFIILIIYMWLFVYMFYTSHKRHLVEALPFYSTFDDTEKWVRRQTREETVTNRLTVESMLKSLRWPSGCGKASSSSQT